MAISDTQLIDLLVKKVIGGVAKTDTASAKSVSNETIASPLPVYANQIWAEPENIPNTPPISNTSAVSVRTVANSSSQINLTMDATSTTNRTFLTGLVDWISPTFGSNYAVKIYRGNPALGGVQIFPNGSGNSDSYMFDYTAGVLNFADTNIPSGITSSNVWIEGYRYIGAKGVASAAGSTKTYIVANIAARDALTGLKAGDGAFVLDASADPQITDTGEYAEYRWTGSAWKLISTEDAVKVDASSIKITVNSSTTGPIVLATAGNIYSTYKVSRIIGAEIKVNTVFDGNKSFNVGTDGNNTAVLTDTDYDLTQTGNYVRSGGFDFPSGNTEIKLFTSGSSTVGSATIYLTYV
jgi:hypothetical protein